ELASELRYSILTKLAERMYKQNEIAKELDMTLQESHRQFERLINTGLVKKNLDGLLSLMSYGKIIVIQLNSFSFLRQNIDYFKDHTIEYLPIKFLRRIGDLHNSKFREGSYVNNEEWKSILTEAEEYTKIISSQVPPDAFKLAISMISKKEITVYLIHGENTIIPRCFKEELIDSDFALHLRSLISRGVYQRKMVKRVELMMVFNEKRGIILFPNLKGKVDLDYSFLSDDPLFHEWCNDYFNDVWQEAGVYDVNKLREF
ncbi:MAG TPA: hypothetical protein VF242_07375, partial [Nitrososphaeraceae archaeon]